MRVTKTVSLSLSAALLVGMMGLTGCNQDRVSSKNVKNSAHRLNVYDQGGRGANELSDLKYNAELSKKVTEVGAVQTAHVMTTGSEAFVAVTLNGTNPSRTGASDMNPNATGIGNMYRVNPNGANTGNVTGRTSSLGRPMGQGVNPGGSDYRPNGAIGANDLGTTPGTLNNGPRMGGGLGVNTDNTGTSMYGTAADVPADVKKEIEDKIKASAPNIKQVYTSANQDFVNRVGTYSTGTDGTNLGTDLTHGVRNVGRDLTDMIESIFPMRKANLAPAPGTYNTTPARTNGMGTGTGNYVNPAR